jgi:hypothetical protein
MLKQLAIVFSLATYCLNPSWGQNTQSGADSSAQSQSAVDYLTQSQPKSRHHKRSSHATTQGEDTAQPGTPKPDTPPATIEDKEQKVAVQSLPPIALVRERKTLWDYVFDWGPWVSTFLLAVVCGLEVWLLLRTWRTIERQNAIQAAGMTQWVDLEPQGVFVDSRPETDPPTRITANLQWKIVNRTPFPLTIQTVQVYICRHKDWEVFEYAPNEMLPPIHTEGRQNHYKFMAPLNLTKAETERFVEEGIALSVMIGVVYEDAMKEERRQSFGDMYDCGIGKLEVAASLGQNPSNTYTEKDDSPSTIRRRKLSIAVPNDVAGTSSEEEE